MITINLRNVLEKKDISIKEIFEKTGISRNTLSLMANGKTTGIQFDTLEKLLGVLDCDIEDLITYSQQNFDFGFLLPGEEYIDSTKSKNYNDEAYFSFGFSKNYIRKIVFNSSVNEHGVIEINISDDESYFTDDLDENEIEQSLRELRQIMSSNHYMYDLFSYLFIYNLELCKKMFIPEHSKYVTVDLSKLSFLNEDKVKPQYLLPTPDQQATLTLLQYKNFIEKDEDYKLYIKHDETMVKFEAKNSKE